MQQATANWGLQWCPHKDDNLVLYLSQELLEEEKHSAGLLNGLPAAILDSIFFLDGALNNLVK